MPEGAAPTKLPPFVMRLAVLGIRARDTCQFLIGRIRLLRALRRGQVREMWIGDSHAALCNDERWPWPVLQEAHTHGQWIWHLGPRLMFSVARDGLPRSVTRLARAMARADGADRIPWLFAFGEIDIRCHLATRIDPTSDPLEFVATYVRTVHQVTSAAGARRAFVVVPPPPSDASELHEEFPVTGTLAERIAVHGRVAQVLREAAAAVSDAAVTVTVIDSTPALADGNGALRDELTFDGCHTNEAGRAAMRTYVLAALGGLEPEQP